MRLVSKHWRTFGREEEWTCEMLVSEALSDAEEPAQAVGELAQVVGRLLEALPLSDAERLQILGLQRGQIRTRATGK